MASLYVTEYLGLGRAALDTVTQAPTEPALTEQLVAIGGSSTQSAAFSTRTRLVRVHCDAICSVAFGPNPTAVNTAKRLAANQTEYFAVNGGDKLAVITNV
jgi:hypothetical protein